MDKPAEVRGALMERAGYKYLPGSGPGKIYKFKKFNLNRALHTPWHDKATGFVLRMENLHTRVEPFEEVTEKGYSVGERYELEYKPGTQSFVAELEASIGTLAVTETLTMPLEQATMENVLQRVERLEKRLERKLKNQLRSEK